MKMCPHRDISIHSQTRLQIVMRLIRRKCPVCESLRIFPLRRLKGQRTKRQFPVFACLTCGSLHNSSGYKEDNEALIADREWHKSVFDRNIRYSRPLIENLLKIHPHAVNLLDIGAGIGSLIKVAQEYGFQAKGVEPNQYAVQFAKEKNDIELDCCYFHQNIYKEKFDIITCISVLEHLENPRLLFQEASSCLNRDGIMYVSVPFYEIREGWKYILSPGRNNSPFFDNDVHIVHFSKKGLVLMGKQLKAKHIQKLELKDSWTGVIFRFNE
jgi:SAM-dependent methyltransferase